MQVSYGPPGHRGVTHLMAVGAADLEDAPPVESALMLSAVTMGIASLLGFKNVAKLAGVATVGLGAAALFRRRTRTVEVTNVR